MTILWTIVVAVLAAEALAIALVYGLRPRCPWLIVTGDLHPRIDERGLARFVEHGWDAELGWVRKPNTAHDETGQGGRAARYHIGPDGARRNPGFDGSPAVVAAFGDSYTFARQVNDDETWAHSLSRQLGVPVANFGVGNYGLDQALLRYEREAGRLEAGVVIMGVVPETISRVLSQWKHFSEYGNVFAFKPRFTLDAKGDLRYLPNPIAEPAHFRRIDELLPALKANDYFYERKFCVDVLRVPFVWSIWRTRRRTLPLLRAAVADRIAGGTTRTMERVMEQNIAIASRLYREAEPLALMTALSRKFAAAVRARGAQPLFLMLPQLYDLRRLAAGDPYYRPFLQDLAREMPVLDLAPAMLASGDPAAWYVQDRYGGHLSADGNRRAAELIAGACRPMLKQPTAGRTPREARAAT